MDKSEHPPVKTQQFQTGNPSVLSTTGNPAATLSQGVWQKSAAQGVWVWLLCTAEYVLIHTVICPSWLPEEALQQLPSQKQQQ